MFSSTSKPPTVTLQKVIEARLATKMDLLDATPVDVEDEREDESEAIKTHLDFENSATAAAEGNDDRSTANLTADMKKLEMAEANLKHMSEQVVVSETLKDYERLWANFREFCIRIGYESSEATFEAEFKPGVTSFPENLPRRVSTWIMEKCDDIDIFTSQPKGLAKTVSTYSHAQKMRAAISHVFGRTFGQGNTSWIEIQSGRFVGNPSLSTVVCQYMVSLRRRKVRQGEIVTSARAIDAETLRLLYEFNMNFVDKAPASGSSRKRKTDGSESKDNPNGINWGGKEIRTMLQPLYIISFLCLLRYDEALRIEWHWLEFLTIDGQRCLKISLPFRKTHQIGNIAPFFLYENKEQPWLCPIKALSDWIQYIGVNKHYNGELSGFVFRRKVSMNVTSDRSDKAMLAESFLACFRHNLVDIGIDPRPYGTHSFRRGGCQYLHSVVRWQIRDICSWAGWAPDFDNSATIFKYLMSWTDRHTVPREHYFNRLRKDAVVCGHCGRSCWCS